MVNRNILGFPGYTITRDGDLYSSRSGATRKLKPTLSGVGYFTVTLCRDGKEVKRYVHRLLLEAFVGPCPPKHECLHINGCRTDNRIANLRWGTKSENVADAIRHGTATIGHRNKEAIYTPHDVLFMRDMWAMNFSTKEIARHFKGTARTIHRAVTGETYKEI